MPVSYTHLDVYKRQVNAPQPTTQEATEPRLVVAVNDITDEQTEPEIAVQAAPQPTALMETAPVQIRCV